MPMDTLSPVHQPPRIEDEPVDIGTIEPYLNTDVEENTAQQEGFMDEIYETS